MCSCQGRGLVIEGKRKSKENSKAVMAVPKQNKGAWPREAGMEGGGGFGVGFEMPLTGQAMDQLLVVVGGLQRKNNLR